MLYVVFQSLRENVKARFNRHPAPAERAKAGADGDD
jgi:hypothetical protein